MRVILLHTTIREEEKLIATAAHDLGIELSVLDAREILYHPTGWQDRCDVTLERCVSTTIGMQAILFFESLGIPVVNSYAVAERCENKFWTSLLLIQHGIPTPPFALTFSLEQAKQAVEFLGGYPVVIKPLSGSWGRLLAKANDVDALEGIFEQKHILGSPQQKALYLQKFVDKGGKDIRATVVGDKVLCAIYRQGEHWITNTARGARVEFRPLDKDLTEICLKAAEAVGGGVLGIDLFETGFGYSVNEINHTPEFKNVQRVTGVDVAREIVNYCQEVALR